MFLKLKLEDYQWDLHFVSACVLKPLIQAKNVIDNVLFCGMAGNGVRVSVIKVIEHDQAQ